MSYARHARMHVHRRACADACWRCERRTGTCWAPSDRRPVRRSALPHQRTRVATGARMPAPQATPKRKALAWVCLASPRRKVISATRLTLGNRLRAS